MRLSELNPRWVTGLAFSVPIPVAVSFWCPHCMAARLHVPFRNPIDPEGLLANTNWQPPEPSWDRQGDTFDTLTLLPSVDASPRGHWHGHITNGEVSFA